MNVEKEYVRGGGGGTSWWVGWCSSLNLGSGQSSFACWLRTPPTLEESRPTDQGGGGVRWGLSGSEHCTLCNFNTVQFHTVQFPHCENFTLCNFNTVQFPHCANFTVYNLHTIYIVRCSRQSTALCNGDFRVLACVQLGSVLVLVCNLLVHQHNVQPAI